MTAEPIAAVVADIRAGRVQHVIPEQPVNGYLLERARLPQPVVDASAIYRSLMDRAVNAGINMYEDFSSTVSPWTDALIGYVNTHGNVIVLQVHQEPWTEERRWETTNLVDWGRVRWLVEASVWVGGRSKGRPLLRPQGPAHLLQNAVYDDGSAADLHWVSLLRRQGDLGTWEMPLAVLNASLNFLACQNVEVAEPQRPFPVRQRLRKTRVQVQTIVVRPPGKRRASSGEARPMDEVDTQVTSVRGSFACVDDATEILTRRGWLGHKELQAGEGVAGFDMVSGEGCWTTLEAVHQYEYNGPLVAVDHRSLSMRVTFNHRAVAIRARRERRGPEFVYAADLRPKHAIPRRIPTWVDDGREQGIGMDLAALCGWVAAEGTVEWSTEGVRLCQSSTANPEHVSTIDALLARIELPVADRSARRSKTWCKEGRVARWVEPDGTVRWRLPLGLSQRVLALLPEKSLPAWFSNLPLNEAEAVLTAFVDGDGHRRPDGRILITQKRRECLDVLQVLALRLGWSTNLRWRPAPARSAAWHLYLSRGDTAILRHGRRSLIDVEQYSGTVWCPTTGTGTFIARRDGRVFVTGNSYGPQFGTGLLFGKLAGKFWRPAHIRGKGEAEPRDYVLKPGVAS